MDSDDFHQGEQLGKYHLISQLSVGGMAELFLGYTAGPGGFRKYVAIKRILPEVRSHEAFVRMFLDEARICALFNHPNIAQVYELGEQEDGLFLAMEFIAGQNLDQLTAAYRRRQEPIPLGLTLSVMRDVCLALHYAHTFTDPLGQPSPVIHRDVAQKNIMMGYDGVVKLLDFGIAKARNSLDRTHVGTVKGTSGYMSPEQVRGEKVDGRSDVFSVGVVLWELVTGERLFAGKTERDEMVNVLQAPIAAPWHPTETMSQPLVQVMLRALERDVIRRYQSALELARALELAAFGLLFDADQRGSVMRSLFEKKMAGTQALLETVGVRDERSAPTRAAPTQAEVTKPQPEAHPTWGNGSVLYEEESSAEQVAKGLPLKTEELPKAKDEAPKAPDTRVEARVEEPPTPASQSRTLNSMIFGGVLAIIVLGGGFLAWRVTQKLNENVEPLPVVPAYTDPRLKLFPEKGQPAVPQGGVSDAGPAESAAADSPPTVPAPPVSEDRESKPSKAVRGPQGKMTLIINPEAQVFLGKKSLGKTPLFNAPMPVGTNLLRIVGPDKKARVLSVPIEAGKTAMHRFSLHDIPEAH